jgi:dTDP-4-dehydrorhamnose 3,5-epimerase
MQIIKTGIEGLLEIIPQVYHDQRGWFFEFYKEEPFHQHGIPYKFTQENISFSQKGVIRGLHFQLEPWQQAKLVSVLSGRVIDVVVDLRKGSTTFGKTYMCELDSKRHNLLMVPEGFAHGFAAMEDSIFLYKSSNLYNRDFESGIIWNDPDLDIQWPFANPVLSEKDQKLATLSELLGKSVISQV